MKINIELNYADEQIEFFAQSKNKPQDESLNDFAVRCLTEILTERIVEPFINNTVRVRREEENALIEDMRNNAQAGITISVE